jgi:hypothetical protein
VLLERLCILRPPFALGVNGRPQEADVRLVGVVLLGGGGEGRGQVGHGDAVNLTQRREVRRMLGGRGLQCLDVCQSSGSGGAGRRCCQPHGSGVRTCSVWARWLSGGTASKSPNRRWFMESQNRLTWRHHTLSVGAHEDDSSRDGIISRNNKPWTADLRHLQLWSRPEAAKPQGGAAQCSRSYDHLFHDLFVPGRLFNESQKLR